MSGAAMCLRISDVSFALGPRCILWHSRSDLVLTSMEIAQRDNSRDTEGYRFDSFQGGGAWYEGRPDLLSRVETMRRLRPNTECPFHPVCRERDDISNDHVDDHGDQERFEVVKIQGGRQL